MPIDAGSIPILDKQTIGAKPAELSDCNYCWVVAVSLLPRGFVFGCADRVVAYQMDQYFAGDTLNKN